MPARTRVDQPDDRRDSKPGKGVAGLLAIAPMFCVASLYAGTIDTSGQAPYEQCGYCHEYDGNTHVANFPRLAGQWPGYLRKQLEDFRARRRVDAHMNPTAELLSDQDIAAVASYFSVQTPQALALSSQPVKEMQQAERLFRQGDGQRGLVACIQCHGGQGEGIAGLAPAIAGQQPDYLESQLQAFKAGRRRNDAQQVMRRIASLLKDGDIRLLTDYLARMEPQKALPENGMQAQDELEQLGRAKTSLF